MKQTLIVLTLIFLFIGCNKKSSDKTTQVEAEKQSQNSRNEIATKQEEIKDLFKKIKKIETPNFTRGIYLTGYTVASENFEPLLRSS